MLQLETSLRRTALRPDWDPLAAAARARLARAKSGQNSAPPSAVAAPAPAAAAALPASAVPAAAAVPVGSGAAATPAPVPAAAEGTLQGNAVAAATPATDGVLLSVLPTVLTMVREPIALAARVAPCQFVDPVHWCTCCRGCRACEHGIVWSPFIVCM